MCTIVVVFGTFVDIYKVKDKERNILLISIEKKQILSEQRYNANRRRKSIGHYYSSVHEQLTAYDVKHQLSGVARVSAPGDKKYSYVPANKNYRI